MDKILIVEDEKLIREELRDILENEGYAAEYVTDFSDVCGQIKEKSPDLILLDVNLPGQDGYRLCTAVRKFSRIPILFLTGRDTAMDELQALTLGGDDYMAKPFHVPVLLARIRLLLGKRKGTEQKGYLDYKGIRLFFIAGTVEYEGRKAELTKTELKIMYYLFSHPQEIVPRIELVEYLWDNGVHLDDNTLSVNVGRIREKLSNIGAGELIQTRRGLGYKLAARD